jgi:general secretion pathway protein M
MAVIAELWSARSDRERLLLGVAGALLALLVVSFGLVRPAFDARADGAAAYARASALLTDARAAADEAAVLRAGGAARPRDATSVRTSLTEAARAAGVAITRLEPAADGRLAVSLDAVGPAAFYDWVARLERDHGVPVASVNLRRNDQGGTVRASVVVLEGAR